MLAFGQPVDKSRRLNPWLKKQQLRLLALKDTLLDSMTGVARDNLRTGHDAHEVSAHGLHQADAGSDAYDRDFALNLLSQEQDALFEIDEALKRVAKGNYGTCEMSGKPIPKARLEARPFARFTVECQNEIEKKNRFSRLRQPVGRLFDSLDEESGEDSDEETSADSKE
jgi:RNA polymerase-binding protein DksA